MLWVRAALFSILVPGTIAVLAPVTIRGDSRLAGGVWNIGWALVVGGAFIYLHCLLRFLAANGTPTIFFAGPLRFLVGGEPSQLVRGGLYRYSRNPMYIGVLSAVFGQALLYGSRPIGVYCLCLCAFFHFIVVLVEEPHLRSREGPVFVEYCRKTPRWITLW